MKPAWGKWSLPDSSDIAGTTSRDTNQVVCAFGPLNSPSRSGGEGHQDDGLARIVNQGIPIL